jgi:RNA polymerase sigma-70 factor, ECF subfamily
MSGDRELIQRFHDGDESAFDELVRRHQEKVQSLAGRLVRNREDACDVAQEVFVRVYRALGKFRGDAEFSTWLHRITVNQAFNLLRARKRQKPTISIDEPGEGNPGITLVARETPADDFRQTRLREAIDEAVAVLPERQRAVFVLRQFQGLRHDEIARILKCSTGAVKAHYHFAVYKLRGSLKDWV